jgi:hypothetical protein
MKYRLIAVNVSWQTKNIEVKDKTKRVLSNGKVVPTVEAMYREVSKIK